jgi:hypothetical protein
MGLTGVAGGQTLATIEQLEAVIRETKACADWLHDRLARARPRLVLVTAYYGLLGHGASWACRDLGIPIADVQHGVAGGAHHAYSWPNAQRRGFNTLPTGFLTWSDVECAQMRLATGDWAPTLLSIGNSWRLLDEMIRSGNDLPMSLRSRSSQVNWGLSLEAAAIAQIKARNPGTKHVLIALHPEEKVDWLAELRRIAPDDWRFWVRLHPGDVKNTEVMRLANDRTFVAEPTHVPLNVLLNAVDVVLAKYSSVILDAQAFGVPAIAYSEVARVMYGGSDRTKISYTIPSAPMIRDAIAECLASDSGRADQAERPIPFDVLGRTIFDELCASGFEAAVPVRAGS